MVVSASGFCSASAFSAARMERREWKDGTINRKEIKGTDVVAFVNVPSSGQADTITGVRVFDNNGALAGQQAIKLQRSSLNTALLRFTFPLIEETEGKE